MSPALTPVRRSLPWWVPCAVVPGGFIALLAWVAGVTAWLTLPSVSLAQQNAGQPTESLEQLLAGLDEELGWDASALFPPDAGGASALAPSQRRPYVDAACAGLSAGVRKDRAPSASELTQARDSLKQAEAYCPDDPRLSYAAGLISLAAEDWDRAVQHLDEAADRADLPHPGALAGLVFAQLSRSDSPAATESLRDLAELLGNKDEDWPGPTLSRALAEWLGRAAACVPATTDKVPAKAKTEQAPPAENSKGGGVALKAELAALLPVGLQPPFERGFTAVEQRRNRLLAWAALTPDQLRTETAESRGKIESQLEQLRTAEQRLIDRRRQLEGPHAEAVQELTQRMRQQATRLQSEVAESRRILAQIDRLNSAANKGNNKAQRGGMTGRRGANGRVSRNNRGNTGNTNSAANDRDRQQKIKELREKLQNNNDQVAQLKRDLEKNRDERRDLDAEHADELKEVKQQLNEARRRRQQTEEDLADLKAALSSPAELKKRAESPETWLPLNLEEQRDALTRAFRASLAG